MSVQIYLPPFDGSCPDVVKNVHNLSHYEWDPEKEQLVMFLRDGTYMICPDMKIMEGRLVMKCINVKVLETEEKI